MIFLSIGLPSRFAEWCDGIICALVHRAMGSVDIASGNTLEDIALASIKSQAPQLVIGARRPADLLRTALLGTGRRFVVALDDPHVALQNLVTRHGLEWKSAVRAIATSCASMLNYTAMPGALVLRADQEGRDPAAAAAAIVEWLDLDVSPADIAALAAGQPDQEAFAAGDDHAAWREGISPTDRAIADGALDGYADYFGGAGMGHFVWRRDLFYLGDEPDTAADRAIDVSGPVRFLLYGPYIALPPGQWAATIVLAVSKEAADLSYGVEILAGSQFGYLARGTIQPRREGLCETIIDFAIPAALDQPIELRIANLRPAFNGRLALGHIALSPRLQPRTEMPAEMTTALGL